MGDPTYAPCQSQDVGNSTNNDVFPCINTVACAPSANIKQSYCNSDDEFCDSGNSLATHLSYFNVFRNMAAQFIVRHVIGLLLKIEGYRA